MDDDESRKIYNRRKQRRYRQRLRAEKNNEVVDKKNGKLKRGRKQQKKEKVMHPMQMRKRREKVVVDSDDARLQEIVDMLPKPSSELCLDKLNEESNNILKKVHENFVWLRKQGEDNWKLYKLDREGDQDSVLFPWFEVRQSIKSDRQTKYLYGLFALRDFKRGSIVGAYIGQFLEHGSAENSFLMRYTEDIAIDIPDKGYGRLSYALGAHMMNDLDYPFGISGKTDSLNNIQIESDYSCVAKKDIAKGDELTVAYNYTS